MNIQNGLLSPRGSSLRHFGAYDYEYFVHIRHGLRQDSHTVDLNALYLHKQDNKILVQLFDSDR